MKAAGAMGFKPRTVYDARETLGLIVEQSSFGKNKHSLWRLSKPSNRAIDALSIQANTVGTIGKIGTNEADLDDVEAFEVQA
jgi:hypothetical protein